MKKGIVIDEETDKVINCFDLTKGRNGEAPEHDEVYEFDGGVRVLAASEFDGDFDELRTGDVVRDGKLVDDRIEEQYGYKFVDEKKVAGKKERMGKRVICRDKELDEEQKNKAEKQLGMKFKYMSVSTKRNTTKKEIKKLRKKKTRTK